MCVCVRLHALTMSNKFGGARWSVFMALVFQLATRSEGNWLKNFAKPKPQLRLMEGVTEHLHNVMPYEQVQFSNPNVSTAYISSTKFQAAGMGHLYFVTNKFIQYILSDQAFPEGIIYKITFICILVICVNDN